MKKLLLASGSPYRRQQLEQLGLSFQWQAPDIDESPLSGESAPELAARLALAKAQALAGQGDEYLIIAGDQCATDGKSILGKPGTVEAAQEQLRRSSGKQLSFFSSICILQSSDLSHETKLVETKVSFRSLTESQIQYYVAKERPLDCAGSFKSEAMGIALFESVNSDDPSALIGLPLIALCELLKQFQYDVLSERT